MAKKPRFVYPRAYEIFHRSAFEFYVAARASHTCQHSLVTGHLIHHAVVLLLKGELSKKVSLEKLWDQCGNDIPKLWTAFKSRFPDEDFSEFETLISMVGRSSSLEQSDIILEHGNRVHLGWGRGKTYVWKTPKCRNPEYQIGMGDVDALFGRLVPLCRIDPRQCMFYLSNQGRTKLKYRNLFADTWP